MQIDNDEVELWVVKALTTKLIDCKMDQLNQVVLVRYSFSPSTHTHTNTEKHVFVPFSLYQDSSAYNFTMTCKSELL